MTTATLTKPRRSPVINRGGPSGTAEELDIIEAWLAESAPIRAEQEALRASILPELRRLEAIAGDIERRHMARLAELPYEQTSGRKGQNPWRSAAEGPDAPWVVR